VLIISRLEEVVQTRDVPDAHTFHREQCFQTTVSVLRVNPRVQVFLSRWNANDPDDAVGGHGRRGLVLRLGVRVAAVTVRRAV
jgi:hypothetical protein